MHAMFSPQPALKALVHMPMFSPQPFEYSVWQKGIIPHIIMLFVFSGFNSRLLESIIV